MTPGQFKNLLPPPVQFLYQNVCLNRKFVTHAVEGNSYIYLFSTRYTQSISSKPQLESYTYATSVHVRISVKTYMEHNNNCNVYIYNALNDALGV